MFVLSSCFFKQINVWYIDYSSKAQQRSWTTMTARWQHDCLWQDPCMDVSMMELSKRGTLEGKNREEGNGKPPRLFSLDMIPIDGCFEDVLQQWSLFFVVDCRLPSDGSHWPAVGIAEYQKKKTSTGQDCSSARNVFREKSPKHKSSRKIRASEPKTFVMMMLFGSYLAAQTVLKLKIWIHSTWKWRN